MTWFKSQVDFLKAVAQEVSDDEVPAMSASIAYFAVLSLPPLLAVVVMIAGAVFPAETVRAAVTGELGDILGEDGAAQLATMLEQARDVGTGGLGTQILGVLALVFGATGAFVQLQKALNRAWDVEPDPERSGIKVFVVKRVMSFGMIMALAFLLAISLVLSALINVLSEQVGQLLGEAGWLILQIADVALPLLLFTLLFAGMFKVLPDARITWRVVWVGAFFPSFLFVLGRYLIGAYFGSADIGAAFGAAGSLVIVLVWIYYTSLLLLVGAEFTQVWARRYGEKILPDAGAVRVVTEHRIEREEEPSAAPDENESMEDRERADQQSPSQPRPPEDGEVRHPQVQGRAAQPRSGINPEPRKDR
jgi:membrane protein